MKIQVTLILSLIAFGSLQADDKIAGAQQALKDQGFYYGDINGQKDTETTAAIRRFQIRNGLQINGDLNEETLKSIRSNADEDVAPTTSSTPDRSVVIHTPTPAPDTSELREDSVRPQQPQQNAGPAHRFIPPEPGDRSEPPVYSGGSVRSAGGDFAGTPYENAPPEAQRKVVVRAQKTLAQRGLFKSEINGEFGPDLEFSLRAYQARVGLQRTGRLDLQTLAALELLPGAHEPVYAPRRGVWLPPGAGPPVRGEWIRP